MAEDHILIVDDDAKLLKLLRRYLSDNGFICSVAESAEAALQAMNGLAFDLLVVDVMMPGQSGLAFTRTVREDSDVPVLLLTARGAPDDRIAGLEAGADDYLAKPFEPRELLLRIHSILRRRPPPPPQVAEPVRLGRWLFDPVRDRLVATAGEAEEVLRLTTAEAALLRALADARGGAVGREALVERGLVSGTPRTVDVQVTRLRRKIEPDPAAPRYLLTVRGEGYALRPD